MTTGEQDMAIATMLDSLAGAWAEAPMADRGCPAASDPLDAIACVFDRPGETGPLAGQRLAIKDNIAVAGVATAIGSGEPGFVGSEDAVVVARAVRAGARPFAKAQCEAFLLGANSFSSRPAPVRNPHEPSRSAGGSSSGSAAMVAAGLADIALGTDSAGSIRIPAAHCGIVGFAPTRGRLPYTGIAPLEPFLERVGPLARNVADARALFAAIDGPDARDARQHWCRSGDDAAAPPAVRDVSIAVLDSACELASVGVGAAVGNAIDRIERAGGSASTFIWPAFEEAQHLHLALYLTGDSATARGAVSAFAASTPAGWHSWRAQVATPPLVEAMAVAGRKLEQRDAALYARAQRRALHLADALDVLIGDHHAVLLPTCAAVAPLVPDTPDADAIFGDTRLTAPFNVTGHPAISIPCGVDGRMPIGLQLVGRREADFALLAVAETIAALLDPVPLPQGDFGKL
jgi:amidase